MKSIFLIFFLLISLSLYGQPPGSSSLNPKTGLRTDGQPGKVLRSENYNGYVRYNHVSEDSIDNQILEFDAVNRILTLDNGGEVDLSSLVGSIVTIYDTSTYLLTIDSQLIDLSLLAVDHDNQQLGESGNKITLQNGGEVDLSRYFDNTDSQLLGVSYPNDSTAVISITSGNSINVKLGAGGTDAQLIHYYEVFDNQIGGSITTSINLGNLPDLNHLCVNRPGIGCLVHDSGGIQRDYSVSGANIIFHEPLQNETISIRWVE